MRGSPGFTLVELLGVLSVILLLTTFAVPAYANILDETRQTKSRHELELIEGALERYKAEKGHYPDRLGHLVTEGYLKQEMAFKSPWWSNRNRIRYFYAVNGRDDSATAYALGDPGRGRNCGHSERTATSPHPRLDEGAPGPIPCGRYPDEPAWVFSPDQPTLDLYDADGQQLPPGSVESLAGFCCDLITEQ